MPNLRQGNIFDVAREEHSQLVIIFGKLRYSRMREDWRQFRQAFPNLNRLRPRPPHSWGPTEYRTGSWIWFVADANGKPPLDGMTDERLLEVLNQTLSWARERTLTRIITNGIVDASSGHTADEIPFLNERRTRLLAEFAYEQEHAYPGLELTLTSRDSEFVRTDRTPTVPRPRPEQFLSINRKDMGNVTFYYPGSGSDWGPLKLFAENCDLAEAVHVDYGIPRDLAKEPLLKFDCLGRVIDISPKDLSAKTWNDFWPEDEEAQSYGQPENAFGFRSTLNLGKGKRCAFLFLATEAIETFHVIYKSKAAPTIIVLQDHGWGGNWTKTLGRGGVFEHLARALEILPKYLFVADNTEPWDGYEQVTEYVAYEGQMHLHGRALYRLIQT